MRQRRYFFPLVLFLCAVVILMFYPTDKKRIKKIINSSEKAIIHEDLDELMKHISYNYKDDYGGSYLNLKKRMQIVFKNLDEIDITKDIVKISVEGAHAEAELNVRVIASQGDNRGYIIGDAVEAQTIKIYFEKSPYKWKVTKVDGVFDYYQPIFQGIK
jgi:hypothetical protein